MNAPDFERPIVATEVVIFTIRERKLQLLLVRSAAEPYGGRWALPGGFVRPREGLEEAARRELAGQTGVAGVYLEQLYTFGRPARDPRGRVISVAYCALIPSARLRIRAAAQAEAVDWFALDRLPQLAFDHEEIVALAHRRLVAKLDYSTIAFQFLPERFTLSELQEVYETVLGQEMDKRNFRKWVLALEQIAETEEERRAVPHRPARLYRQRHPGRVAIIK